MRIDPTTERWTRDLLGHAIRGELDEMSKLICAIGDEQYGECSALCISIAAYIGIDARRMQWPGDDDLREMARRAAETTDDYELSASQVFDFLARVVFGSDKLDQVFPDMTLAATLPVLATASILASFRPPALRGQSWWDYLDLIEGALETAASLSPSVLPALMWQSRGSITA